LRISDCGMRIEKKQKKQKKKKKKKKRKKKPEDLDPRGRARRIGWSRS
jgi:hypothetical protein